MLLSISTYLFLLKPSGCGVEQTPCRSHSSFGIALFYLSIYSIALGNGGYQPNIATFGADQFDGEDTKEAHSKIAFFSYFYLALNLGSLFSNTILGYFEDEGMWVLGFWASTASAALALILFLLGTPRYRHFNPKGNPLFRFSQVLVAAIRKCRVQMESKENHRFQLHQNDQDETRKIVHTQGFRYIYT